MFLLFLRNERGATALLFAVMLPVLMAFVGAAVDYSDLVRKRSEMQVAADEAALAGAKVMTNTTLSGSQLQQAATTAATAVAAAKAPQSTPAVTVSISGYNGGTENSVVVGVSYTKPLLFGAFFVGTASSQVAAQAKATPGYTPSDCVLALDPSATKAFSVSGNGSVSVPNCGVRVNSSHRVALSQQGSSTLKAKTINVVGQATGSGFTPTPTTGQAAMADPLANIPEPTLPGTCTYSNVTFSTPKTFAAETLFCGNINFSSDSTFSPGIHYFKNASVTTGNNVNLSGSGVMLYFDAGSYINSTTSGDVNLSAIKTGVYTGIAIFGSRTATSLPVFHFTGGSSYSVNGTVYLPTARFDFLGNSTLTIKSGYVIAKQFNYQGNSAFVMDTFGGSAPAVLASKDLALTQ